MAKRKSVKKKETESVWESFYRFFDQILYIIICIYLFFILAVLPFYNEEGFSHIGTDKAMYFRSVATKCGVCLLPVLVIMLLLKLIIYSNRFIGANNQENTLWKQMLQEMKKYFSTQLSCTDYFAFFYGLSVVVSYCCSRYKEEALWGASGWYMGALPQLFLVFSYFLISRAWRKSDWLIFLILPVSTVVFLLGYLNRFGIYPIDMKVVNGSFISTIGNINWYCGYLVSVFFAGLFLLWQKEWKIVPKILLMSYVLIGFGTMVTQGSSSGIVAMVVMILLTFCLSVSDGKRMEAFWLEMILLSLASGGTYVLRRKAILTITMESEVTRVFTNSVLPIFMLAISVVGYIVVIICNRKSCYPRKLFKGTAWLACIGVVGVLLAYFLLVLMNTRSGGELLKDTSLAGKPMFTFSASWGSSRGATWAGGALCFGEQDFLHKLVGAGPDCMAAFLYTDGSTEVQALVQSRFGTSRLTNAHNEWLTILVDCGILGLISFVGMMISAIKRYISNGKEHIIVGACGFCLLAYTVNNMFSFQQTMSVSTIFVILAVGENYLRNEKRIGKK